MAFREYLLSRRVEFPRVSVPHPDWEDKSTGALIGLLLLAIISPYLGIAINKLFFLLLAGCPFLWFYMNYCDGIYEAEKVKS